MLCKRAPFVVLPLLLFLWGSVGPTGAFNLEPRIPIIKKGPPMSHFGYSVAQHKSATLGPGFQKYTSWMLVGAPKGENLQPGTNKSGALYKCPLTTYTNDCDQVQTDGLKNSDGVYKGNPDGRILPPSDDEIKDDQWMGVTVKSQGEGGDILVCGHRYQHKGIGEQNFQWGYGLCYRLTDRFEYEDNYQPCMGKPVNLGHEQFGYCQAGSSGIILDDEVVLGVPGSYTWRGTVHTRNISNDYLYRDKTQYFGVFTDDDSPVDKYSYLGYSVTAGRFFGDKISYVAGAPRSRGTGQVVFFSRRKIGNPIMNYDLILNGEMFASSFGFEVLAMDTNGDKRDDLVVSAPFYFTPQSSGAVYIYLNSAMGITNETPFTRLEGPPGESRFGFSMTSLGDMNLDGYNDLAVGAPYDGRGAIYIYLGSKDGIVKTPSQVIRAEDLPGLPHDAFGYSLSGGMDLDDNNYSDLLTSSFCSDRVILLRARPIVSIQTEVESRSMQNINPSRHGCIEDISSPETCFSFRTCFKMMNEAGALTSLEVRYNISERVYKDQPVHRIRFHRASSLNPSTVEQIINLRPENMGRKQCFNEIVYLKTGVRDVLRPVRFKLSYEIHQEEPRPVEEGEDLPDINDYPILNQKEAVRYFEATFAKDCGDDEICESDLTVVANLDLEKYSDKDIYIFELGKQQYFNLTAIVINNGEPAYVPNLYVAHDKAIDLSLRETETGTYQCATVVSGLINCNLDNPLVNTTGPLHLVFKPSGLPFKDRKIEVLIWANSTSEELSYKDNRVKLVLDVKRRAEISITGSAEPEQVFYSGDIVGESAVETLDEIGAQVIHKYIVDNRGPWKVDEMQVRVLWPYQVENKKRSGKWLLYLTDIPIVEGDGECDVNPRYVNPLTLGLGQISVDAEVDLASTSRLRGYKPTTPASVPAVTEIKTTKKVVTSQETHKRTYTKTSSSSSLESGSTDRDQTRVSHKSYPQSSNRNRLRRPDHKEGIYYDNTDEYENYDNFFYGSKDNREKAKQQPSFDTDSDRLKAVVDMRTIRENDETYLNGYDENGNLVWTSRSGYFSPLPEKVGGASRTRTEYTRRVTSSGGDHRSAEESENGRLLSKKVKEIVDFQIINNGEESYVNGYDKDSNVVWTSRNGWKPREGMDRGSAVKTEYIYKEKTRNGEGEGTWSSKVTDDHGSRTRSGTSKISRGEGKDTDYDRSYRERKEYSKSNISTENDGSRSSFDWDDHSDLLSGTDGSSDVNAVPRSQVSTSRSYRRKETHSRSKSYDEELPKFDDEDQQQSLRRARHLELNYSDQPLSKSFHGNTYSRAVFDDGSDTMNVLTQKVFSRRSSDRWQEVLHSPYNGEEWIDQREGGETLKRIKREREFIIRPEAITDVQTGKMMQVVTFKCDGDIPTAKCFSFVCTIRNLPKDQSVSIRIPSRLWNSTLVEDYPRVSYISIRSKGELILPDEIRLDQDQTDDVSYAETLAYSNLLEQLPPEEVPIWVIVVSVLAGLILLVLIAIILYKLGFFKRKRPDPTLSGNIDRDMNGYN